MSQTPDPGVNPESPDTRYCIEHPGGWLRDPLLGLLADAVDDLEKVRIANANRLRQLTRDEADSDGEERGFGLPLSNPVVKRLAQTVDTLEGAEHEAVLNLRRAMRAHPLAEYQKRHKGIGEKQLARLLATVGDPYWNDLHDRPRLVSELWSYSGFDVRNGRAPRRTKGEKSNWSEECRKRVWVIASATPKFPGSHYEQVYRQARVKYASAGHTLECKGCGTTLGLGGPAPVGSPLADGHAHARAVRIVAKEILKDLWLESKALYQVSVKE
ncbi:TIGR-Tas system RNA-guided endonuclease [Tsukamurella soli]|uniref:DUF222 domain-containing protein n=1 Tax=Tsukamurella soli TaxID=644556 RepID=A0ABP8JJJ4_9ACTN